MPVDGVGNYRSFSGTRKPGNATDGSTGTVEKFFGSVPVRLSRNETI
jgi:hypothetical protein